jgi:hypothetical protein
LVENMKKILIIMSIFITASCAAYAPSSISFNVTPETFSAGGGDTSSTHYSVHGKLQGIAYGIRTSTDYRVGEGFMNASFNSLSLAPLITSVNPSSGNNNSPILVTIDGTNFFPGVVASLEKSGQSDISGESLSLVNSGQLTCTFNITNRVTGAWDVVVLNTDGRVGILNGGFNVTSPNGPTTIIGKPINFPNPFDPEKAPTTIKFTLSKDAPIVLNIYNINGERIWQRTFTPGSAGGKAGENQVLWDGYTEFSQLVPNGVYVFQIASGGETLATGKIAVFR